MIDETAPSRKERKEASLRTVFRNDKGQRGVGAHMKQRSFVGRVERSMRELPRGRKPSSEATSGTSPLTCIHDRNRNREREKK
jgi:hypothetical protein